MMPECYALKTVNGEVYHNCVCGVQVYSAAVPLVSCPNCDRKVEPVEEFIYD